jgi:pepF/M3 family oligoendopeptidase
MTVVYPGIDSPEFKAGFSQVASDIDALARLFDERGVRKQAPAELSDTDVQAFETAIERYNAVTAETETLAAYLYSFISTDSRDGVAQAALSELEGHMVKLAQLETRWTAWVGSLDVEALIARSAIAAEHAFTLRIARQQAAHLMSPAEEALATELNLTGGTAWQKLYRNLSSQIMVRVERDGASEELPMSVVRSLAFEPERETRRGAYEAELQGWQNLGVPIAAALNSIKGEVNSLARRRGWSSPLDAALFDNRIDRQTLDAMLGAARESFPILRRYLQAKARLLGLPKLAWYDLFAPVGESTREWSYEEGTRFIVEQFGTYSDKMRDFAARAFDERWIDAEPRQGKGGGAFCMRLRGAESRILSNFKPSFDSVGTLAHELGHGYHNLVTAERTPLQRGTPMTLAETASIFCETLIREAALAEAKESERLAILEASLQDATQLVVDISSRFLFEQRVFEARRERELSVDELCGFMLGAQRETYGDGLDGELLHPYMWAAKGHYYSTGLSFYNFPYMFGQLFVLGLYARYREEPASFKARYDDLLSSTGLEDATNLAARFGIDIRTPDFWRSSLDVIRRDVERFEELVK